MYAGAVKLLYVNGTFQQFSDPVPGPVIFDTCQLILVADVLSCTLIAAGLAFNGTLDYVRIYNRALAPTLIATLAIS